jgi:tRNA-dihydrouridine synthase B
VHQLPQGDAFCRHMNTLENAQTQHQAVADFFDALAAQFERLPHPLVSSESLALAPHE